MQALQVKAPTARVARSARLSVRAQASNEQTSRRVALAFLAGALVGAPLAAEAITIPARDSLIRKKEKALSGTFSSAAGYTLEGVPGTAKRGITVERKEEIMKELKAKSAKINSK